MGLLWYNKPMKTGARITPERQPISEIIASESGDVLSDILQQNSFLRSENTALEIQREQMGEEIDQLEERIRILEALIFGRKSEKRVSQEDESLQPLLFSDEIESSADPLLAEDETTSVDGHTRKKRGRKPIPKDFPRVDVIYDLTEDEKLCACGCTLTRIGEEVSEELDIIPAKIQVIRNIRYKYACQGCEGVNSGNVGAVKTAPLPAKIIPQGIVTAGLLAHVAVAKFADALPFYRQERQFIRIGLDITRGTLSNWMMLVAAACGRLGELLLEAILAGPVINMDETPVQVLNEPGRANTQKSYMWVLRGGPPDRPGVIFRYEPTRFGNVPLELLCNYHGFLQTDGYQGYNAIGSQEDIRHLGCWAHVRRKFIDVTKGTKGTSKKSIAQEILNLIGKLYKIEKEVSLFPPGEGQAERKEKAEPLLKKIKETLDLRKNTTPPKSLLGKAINYALNQWPLLEVYLEEYYLCMDNNIAENAIRPFAIGRKNWLFSGSPKGANASALLYSLNETAKANNLEPFKYLKFIFSKIPFAKTDDQLRALLPQNLDRSSLTSL